MEGLGGGIGDQGTSFGPFQLHQGGALPKGLANPQQWANSPAGIQYAISRMSAAKGLKGQAAINAIVRQFERPANPNAEVAGAWAHYQNYLKGFPGSTPVPHPFSSNPQLAQQPTPGIPGKKGQNLMPLLRILGLGGIPGIQKIAGNFGGTTGIPGLPGTPAVSPSKPPTVHVQGKVTPQDVAAVKMAQKFIGTPYQWGGTKPGGFDCSGLIQYVWAQQGIQVPRTTYDQFHAGIPVNKNSLRPGDAVFFTGSDPKNGLPGHVAMYIGNGKVIQSPHTGATVEITKLSTMKDFRGARRFG